MKTTITITKADLDRAIAGPWSARTCVFAQAVARTTGERVVCCHNAGALTETLSVEVEDCIPVIEVFDNQYGRTGARDYAAVAALLPCDVICEVVKKGGSV